MIDQRKSRDVIDRVTVADYVAAISTDLAAMARRTGLETLGSLLEMVQIEAESVLRRSREQGGGD
jgi:hypothetical protein